MKNRKIIALITSLTMLVSLTPINTFAASENATEYGSVLDENEVVVVDDNETDIEVDDATEPVTDNELEDIDIDDSTDTINDDVDVTTKVDPTENRSKPDKKKDRLSEGDEEYPYYIGFDKYIYRLHCGDSIAPSVYYEPDDAVKVPLQWGSYDETVATVTSGGVIKAISAGETEISVSNDEYELYADLHIKVSHKWNKGVVTKKPTATKAGIRTYTCVCGKTKTEKLYKKTGKLASGKKYIKSKSKKVLSYFTYDGKSIMYFYAESHGKSGYLRMCLEQYKNGKWVEKEHVNIYDNYSGWIWCDKEDLKKGGLYRFRIKSHSKYKFKINYVCKGAPNGYAKSAKVNNGKKMTLKAGKNKKFTLQATQSGTIPLVKSVKSSNKKVAKAWKCGHKIYIEGQKRGKCTVTITLHSGKVIKKKVHIQNGTPALKYDYIDWYRGKKIKNRILYNDSKVKWTTTNKKVAKVSSKGTVTCVGLGTCYVIAKVAGKTLKCKVRVSRLDPDYEAYLIDYNTRGNYFEVEVKNNGYKTLKITAGIKALDKDYKAFDRKLKLKKKVSIAPGKTKYIRLYVVGRTTWYDYTDFRIYYKFKYDGKSYTSKVWVTEDYYKWRWY